MIPSYRKSASSRKADRARAIPLPLLQSQSNARLHLPFEIFSLFQTQAKQAGSKPAYIRACHMRGRLYMVVRQFLLIIPSDKLFNLPRRDSAPTRPRHGNTTRETRFQVALGGAFMSAKCLNFAADGIMGAVQL